MAITALTIPSQEVRFNAPRDKMLEFVASAETLTATGYMNSVLGTTTTLDLGGATPVSAVGRCDFLWNTIISTLKVSATDETYRMFLMGSNSDSWANGSIQTLAIHDLAAVTAGRLVATISGATPTVPPTGKSSQLIQIPCTNLMEGILFRYVRGYWVIGGTLPSIIYQSWLSRAQILV